MISTQPFPVVITKGNQLSEDVLHVKLLTGASVELLRISMIQASLMNDGPPDGSSLPNLSNAEQVLSGFSEHLKINKFRRKIIKLIF
jgi:hypothetical protein